MVSIHSLLHGTPKAQLMPAPGVLTWVWGHEACSGCLWMELGGSVCFPGTFPRLKCFHWDFLCGVGDPLPSSWKWATREGSLLLSHLVKKQSTSWKVLCPNKKIKMLTNYLRNKDPEINYCNYNNWESHCEKRLDPVALLLWQCKEDFHFDGESRDRLNRLPSIIKESLVFRIEVEVHILYRTFLYFFSSLK